MPSRTEAFEASVYTVPPSGPNRPRVTPGLPSAHAVVPPGAPSPPSPSRVPRRAGGGRHGHASAPDGRERAALPAAPASRGLAAGGAGAGVDHALATQERALHRTVLHLRAR